MDTLIVSSTSIKPIVEQQFSLTEKLMKYRQIVRDVLTALTKIPYAYGQMECQAVFDTETDRYLLITIGWNQKQRVHGCLVHVDIIAGKVWLQRDDTDFQIASELIRAGIPKQEIVLGFHPSEIRPYTGFAVM